VKRAVRTLIGKGIIRKRYASEKLIGYEVIEHFGVRTKEYYVGAGVEEWKDDSHSCAGGLGGGAFTDSEAYLSVKKSGMIFTHGVSRVSAMPPAQNWQ
jgi:hypothetical protein